MPTVRLTERFAFDGGRVGGTAEAPVIENVLLCGPVSANKRRYLKRAFEGDRVKRYNGVPVKVTVKHGDASGLYQEEIGTVQNARHRADGMPIGDIAVNPKKPYAEAFLWDARHQPRACGMSHVANCEVTRGADGWEDVTELKEAISVDVIGAGHAATTKGIYESGRRAVSLTIKQLAEAVVKHPKSTTAQALKMKALAEMDGMADMPTAMDAPPADDADPNGAITAGFKAAFDAIRDQLFDGSMDKKAAMKKLAAIFDGHGTATDATAGKGGATDDDDDDPTPESKKRPDYPALLRECRVEGFAPTDLDLKALTAFGSVDERKEYMAAHKSKGGETPQSTGRDRIKAEGKDSAKDQPTVEGIKARLKA